jgi:hypothetical protein
MAVRTLVQKPRMSRDFVTEDLVMNFTSFFEVDEYECWHHSHVATRHLKISEFLNVREIFAKTLFRETCGPSISGSNTIRYSSLGDFER